MIFLWTGIGVLFVGVLIYLIILSIYQKERPFRIKLTLLFLLFVLLPTIPLTLLNVRLLTQSARVMMLPGLDDAMHQAMETIRAQSEVPAELFFKSFPDYRDWSDEIFQKYGIECAISFRVHNNKISDQITESSDLFKTWSVNRSFIQRAYDHKATSKLLEIKNQYCLLVFDQSIDSLFYVAGYTLNESIGQAKEQLSQAINMYNTVSLLKETILQKNLVMILAFLLLISLVLLSVMIAGRISKNVNEPIDQLVKGMERVKTGNLDIPIEYQTKGEFAFLADSFNQMMKDLKESHEKLIASEKLAAWREVARRMSHEIKNSLTPITLSIRQIRGHLSQTSEDKETLQSLHVLQDEFNHLKSLAETFSTFAKMPKPMIAEMALNDTIQHVVKLVEPVYPNIHFKLNLEAGLLNISGDYEQMKRVFMNLIQNGADAIKDEGEVTITSKSLQGSSYQVACEIHDTGAGMDEATLASIFRPYFTTKGKGTGLGMPIVKQILNDHEADIDIQSEKGVGTCVVLRFR